MPRRCLRVATGALPLAFEWQRNSVIIDGATGCKRRLKSAAGGARKVRHLPTRRERFLGFEVKSGKFAAR